MTPADAVVAERIREAVARDEDIEIYRNALGDEWVARVVYGEGSDGFNYVYLDAPTAVGVLRALIDVLEAEAEEAWAPWAERPMMGCIEHRGFAFFVEPERWEYVHSSELER